MTLSRACDHERDQSDEQRDLCDLCGSHGFLFAGSHWFATIFRLSRNAPNGAAANTPGAPWRLPIGSSLSIVHGAGSASPVGHALPRARTPLARFSTRSFRWYHASGFQANGTVTVR